MTRLFSIALACAMWAAAAAAEEGPAVRTDNVEARLVVSTTAVAPGDTITVGLHKIIREGWHTYWVNPGDAGEPTRIDWDVPRGVVAGEFIWPLPHKITLQDVITNYGYEGELLLPMRVSLPDTLTPGETLTLRGRATWLVCEEICIPEEARLELSLPVVAGTPAPDPIWAPRLDVAIEAAPRPDGYEASLTRDGDRVRLAVASPSLGALARAKDIRKIDFFPFSGSVIDHNAPQPVRLHDRGVAMELTPAKQLAEDLIPVGGVLAFERREAGTWIRRGVELTARPGAEVELGGALAGPPAGILKAAAFAFLGGLLLNLMPCVFPVLSIKAMSFAQRAHEAPGTVRRHGVFYLLGVLTTFLLLAGALLGLMAVGTQIGWGFQLQSPPVIVFLAVVMFVIGLNFLGAFNLKFGVEGAGQSLVGRGGDVGAFFTGALVVVVASPCTAPFMGVALGAALVQPAPVALAIFAALGLGVAAPFTALAFAPRLLKLMPRPGPWMERLKQALSFPMFAAAAWLVSVVGLQVGMEGVLAALLAMTVVGFAVWTLNAGAGRPIGRIGGALAAALALIAAVYAGSLPVLDAAAAAPIGMAESEDGVVEAQWRPGLVEELRADGHMVFVNFTAAWCLSCQFNKRTTLSRAAVRRAFAENNVAVVTADWTNRDPEIAAELARHGRSGVPLYLLYPREGEPRILPALLTQSLVVNAVEDAAEPLRVSRRDE